MNQKYNLVDSLEKLKQLDAILMDGDKPRYQLLGYDTETNGLALHKTTIVGFSISFDSKSGYYVPILKWVPDESSKKDRSVDKVVYAACMEGKLQCVWTGATFDEFVLPKDYDAKKRIPFIINYLERWLTKTNLLMHNASFDVNQTFINFGVELKNNLFVDTSLLLHVLNENERTGLKAAAERYKVQLGINPHAMAAIEKKEMDSGIIENGGKPGMVWRAPLHTQYKYACSDTFLMYGIYEVAIREFQEKFGEKGLTWFFKDEVMPVCKEVVIDMKRRGVYIDVPHFKRLFEQNQVKMRSLEDQFIQSITPYLNDFPLSKPLEEAVSEQRLIKKIIELEGLKIPTVTNPKTGEQKESLAKAIIHKQFVQNPHWIWGYILGEDEIRYSEDKLNKIRQELFEGSEGRRYRFNLGSRDHLIWLFCTKLGFSKTKLPQTDSATKTNPIPKMDADVLTEFMLPRYPWVATLLTYKKLQKLQSTYIEPALELNVDGWLYMDMKQNGTTSGRFSCSGGYNLQTLPRVDDENEVLESCDKCHSSNVEVIQELECIADRKCLDCGDLLKDVTRPSAIKRGFVAPPGYKIVNADYCLHPKSEILTKRGWVPVLDVAESDLVWQVDKTSLGGSFIEPTRVIRRHYKGKMYRFGNRRGRFDVTENHTMLWVGQFHNSRPDKELFRATSLSQEGIKTTGQSIATYSTQKSPKESRFSTRDIWLSCALQADGSLQYKNKSDVYRIEVSTPLKRQKLNELLGPGKVADTIRSGQALITETWNTVKYRSDLLNGKDLLIENIGDNQVDEFVKALAFWDGHTDSHGRIVWGSTNKGLVERVQIFLVTHGYEAHLRIREYDNENHNTFYSLSIKKLARLRVRRCDVTEYWYDGEVGCVTVPDGFILIRSEGRTFVTGNCSLEPKCFAYVSGESLLKQVYWDNLDLYSKVYCDIFDKEKQYSADPKAPNFLKKVAKAKRTWIKPIVLGIPYGAEAGQVANLIGARTQKRTFKGELVLDEEGNPIMQNDFNEGRRVLEAYLGTYKKLRQYMRDQELKAVSLGYVETLLGRRRHLPFARKINEILGAHGIDWSDIAHGPVNELKKGETVSFRSQNNGNQVVLTKAMFDMIRESIGFKKETAQEKGYWAYVRNLLKSDLNNAKNNPIQGLAGHILNRGTLDTNRKFREAKLDALICLTVHDEVTAYAKNEHSKKASDLMKDGMENNRVAKMLDVAMEADPIICDNLKDSK